MLPALLVLKIAESLPACRRADAALLTRSLFSINSSATVTATSRDWTASSISTRVDFPVHRIKFSSKRFRRLLLRLSPSGWFLLSTPHPRLAVQSTLMDGDPRTSIRTAASWIASSSSPGLTKPRTLQLAVATGSTVTNLSVPNFGVTKCVSAEIHKVQEIGLE